MRKLVISVLLIGSAFADFCKKPAFQDKFLESELSKMWDSAQGYSYDESPAVFTSLNVEVSKKYAVVSVNNITTSDADGETYKYTCGELHTTKSLGYGRYEFEIKVSGQKSVNESFYLLWMDEDYTTDHESIGFEFQESGYLTMLGLGVDEEDEFNVFHATPKNSVTMTPEKLNKKTRKFAIEYTKKGVTWFYNGKAVRQESTKVRKNLPNHKFQVIFRNWLLSKYIFSVKDKDFPVELKVNSFTFYPVDDGGTSCDEIVFEEEKVVEPEVEEVIAKVPPVIDGITDECPVESYDNLELVIENLPKTSNNLLGSSAPITNLAVFKSAKVVWIFLDYEWKAYSPLYKIRETLINHNIPIFSEIPQHTGFWIQK